MIYAKMWHFLQLCHNHPLSLLSLLPQPSQTDISPLLSPLFRGWHDLPAQEKTASPHLPTEPYLLKHSQGSVTPGCVTLLWMIWSSTYHGGLWSRWRSCSLSVRQDPLLMCLLQTSNSAMNCENLNIISSDVSKYILHRSHMFDRS